MLGPGVRAATHFHLATAPLSTLAASQWHLDFSQSQKLEFFALYFSMHWLSSEPTVRDPHRPPSRLPAIFKSRKNVDFACLFGIETSDLLSSPLSSSTNNHHETATKINKFSNYRFRIDFIVWNFVSERFLDGFLVENVFNWILFKYFVRVCVQIIVQRLKWYLQNVFVSVNKFENFQIHFSFSIPTSTTRWFENTFEIHRSSSRALTQCASNIRHNFGDTWHRRRSPSARDSHWTSEIETTRTCVPWAGLDNLWRCLWKSPMG